MNILHIFRDGNGRSTREYIRLLAASGGYRIEWQRARPEEILQAAIRDDYKPLISQIVTSRELDKQLQLNLKKALAPKRSR